jgi:hypothetical protein
MPIISRRILAAVLVFGLLAGTMGAFPRVPAAATAPVSASQALIDAASDCSTVRITERNIDRLLIKNRRKLRVLPAEHLAEVYVRELVIQNSKDCTVENFTFINDTLRGPGLRIFWDGANEGHNALNNVVRYCSFRKYTAGALIGGLVDSVPPDNQWAADSNRFEDCSFENCDVGLLINSANAQLTATRDCVFIGNRIGTYCKLGQYHDVGTKYLLGTEVDVRIENAVLPCTFTGTYTEQGKRFLETGGPTQSGWPITLVGCSIVGSGSPYIWPGETTPRYGDRNFAIIHKQASLILNGCAFGITNTPLYIGVGGGDTTFVDAAGSQFFTAGQEDPILDFNGTMTVTGQYVIRDPAQLKSPKTVTRLSLVNPTVNVVNTVGTDDYLSIRHRGRSIWAKGDSSSGLLSETRFDGTRILVYDATTGIGKQMPLLGLFPFGGK